MIKRTTMKQWLKPIQPSETQSLTEAIKSSLNGAYTHKDLMKWIGDLSSDILEVLIMWVYSKEGNIENKNIPFQTQVQSNYIKLPFHKISEMVQNY